MPAKVAGSWKAQMPPALSKQPATLSLKQQLTRVTGSVRLDGREFPMEDVKLRGDRLTFKLAGRRGEFSGQVKGKQIDGTVERRVMVTAFAHLDEIKTIAKIVQHLLHSGRIPPLDGVVVLSP